MPIKTMTSTKCSFLSLVAVGLLAASALPASDTGFPGRWALTTPGGHAGWLEIRPENGWRVPPSNLLALTETLRSALADIPRLRRMGAESYRIVAEEVNLEVMVSVFMNVLAKIK